MPFGIHKHSNRSKQALNDPTVHGGGQEAAPSTAGSASSPAQNLNHPNFGSSSSIDDHLHNQHQHQHQHQHQLQVQQLPHQQQQQQQQIQSQQPPPPEAHGGQPYIHSPAPESPDPRSFQHSPGSPTRSHSTRYSGAYHYNHQSLHSQSGEDLLDAQQIQQQQQQQQLQLQQQQYHQQQQQQQQQQQHQQHQQQQQIYAQSQPQSQPQQPQQPQQHQQPPPPNHPQARSPAAPAPPPAEHKKSKSIFDRMRAGRENRLSQEIKQGSAPYNNSSGLSRRLSKRQDNPPPIRTAQQQTGSVDQRLHSARDSRSQLPSPQESSENNSDLDPFQQIRESPQEASHGAPQELGQHQTIRAVQSDSEPTVYANEEGHHHYPPPPPPHSGHLSYHQHPEAGAQVQYEIQGQAPYEIQNQGQYEIQNQGHLQQQQTGLQPGFAFHDPYRQQNPETVSQLSYDSPVEQREEQQRPISVQSNGQSPTNFTSRPNSQFPDRTTSIQSPRPLSQVAPSNMPPQPTGNSNQNRRSADPKSGLPSQPPPGDGAPPGYTRGQSFPGNPQPQPPNLSPLPSAVGTQGQGPNYRGGPPQRDQYGVAGGGEQGRSTPPPQPAGPDVAEAYKELQIKYKKVKGLYFEKTSQVVQLQDTLANQRLSQSRTSLDDSEYMTRFQRLDGATINLAFNIRKDWRSIPAWLVPYVNQDANKVGKQEMTAVGRACIAKFLVDEIFNRTFHPNLETSLSCSLKTIEHNIRRFSPALNNQEESDALTAKVVQWRLATLEGMRDVLYAVESEEHRRDFARAATTNLTATLMNYLQDPMPPGIEDSAHMIIELAVSIASNLPLESRDISITYPMPGDFLQHNLMKVETGIPPLENPGVDSTGEDSSSTDSNDKDEPSKEGDKDHKLQKGKPKGGMLQAMMGSGSGGPPGKKPSISSQGGSEGPSGEAKAKSSEDGAQKVRFAGFLGVEVRGRQVLCKAPVWTVGG